jgi:hypothetical protein
MSHIALGGNVSVVKVICDSPFQGDTWWKLFYQLSTVLRKKKGRCYFMSIECPRKS